MAGTATMVLLYHPGQSQLDFIRSALPLLAATAAWGITEGLAGLRHQVGVRVLTMGAGLAACALLAWRVGTAYSPPPSGLTMSQILLPYLLLIATLGAMTVVWLRSRRQPAQHPSVVGAITIFALLFAGAGATRTVSQLVATSGDTFRLKPLGGKPSGAEQQAAIWLPGPQLCARRIRDQRPVPQPRAALRPRVQQPRLLGLRLLPPTPSAARSSTAGVTRPPLPGYPPTGLPTLGTSTPYRSGTHHACNVIRPCSPPTRAEARSLRGDYGVTWVYVDTTYGTVSPQLQKVLTLRYHKGPVSLYQIP